MMEAALVSSLGRTTLGTTKITIGRAADNTLRLTDPKASSHHAEIRPEGEGYNIVDLGSTNGTFVNEQQLYQGVARQLQPGDVIRIGDSQILFEARSAFQDYADRTIQAGPPTPTPAPAPNAPSGPSPAFPGTAYGGNLNYGGDAPNYQDNAGAFAAYAPPPSTQPPYYSGAQPYAPYPYGQSDQQETYITPQSQPPTPLPPTQLPTQLPPASPPPARQRRSIVRTIILAMIALLIILAAVGGLLIHNNQVAQDNADATATAQANATGTAHANASATAFANATATFNAGLTATALVTSPFPRFTSLAFQDPLTTGDTRFPTASACQYQTAGYSVSDAQAGTYQWCRESDSFGDFAFKVNMTITSGDCGGIAFRVVDLHDFYMALVCSDGTYDVGLFQNGNASWATNLATRNSTSNIHQGSGQQNVIAIVVQGNTFNLYINDLTKDVDTVTDNGNTFSQGQVGLVSDDLTNPTTAVYSNALLWT